MCIYVPCIYIYHCIYIYIHGIYNAPNGLSFFLISMAVLLLLFRNAMPQHFMATAIHLVPEGFEHQTYLAECYHVDTDI